MIPLFGLDAVVNDLQRPAYVEQVPNHISSAKEKLINDLIGEESIKKTEKPFVDYPYFKCIEGVNSYLTSFFKQYDRIKGSEEEKIKITIDNMTSLREIRELAKNIKKAYDFDAKTRAGVEGYFKFFLKECYNTDYFDRCINYHHNQYDELVGKGKELKEKYFWRFSANKQRDMIDLFIVQYPSGLDLDPIVSLERAIQISNGDLERTMVDKILLECVRNKGVEPGLEIRERAWYSFIRYFKEDELEYRRWVGSMYENAPERSQQMFKDVNDFIDNYERSYHELVPYLGDNPAKKFNK